LDINKHPQLIFGERELNSRSRSLYVVVRPSVVCGLWSVCNVRALYSDDWNFRQYFYAIGYLSQPLTSR